jgi:hypothetical protein
VSTWRERLERHLRSVRQAPADGCPYCGEPVDGRRWLFLAGEPAVWLPACRAHRTELELAA